MSTSEAFKNLESVIGDRGRPFTRPEAFVVGPSESPEEIIAHGLEREANVTTSYNGMLVPGILSVRALVAANGVRSPFPLCGEGAETAKWFLRTTLAFEVPENDEELVPGGHAAHAAYVLAEGDPERLDNPESEQRILVSNYEHDVPGQINTRVGYSSPEWSSRLDLLRHWFQDSPEADGMAMLSPASFGEVRQGELARVTQWLTKTSG